MEMENAMKILLLMMMTTTLCADSYTDYLESRIKILTEEIDAYDSSVCWGQLTYMLGQRDGYSEALWEYCDMIDPTPEHCCPEWGIPD